jgi:HSP20 family protein
MTRRSLLTPSRDRQADAFGGFRDQLDTYFEDWFGRSMAGTTAPRTDVTEDDHHVHVCVELPGVEQNDIDISIKGDRLVIKGEKKSEHEHKDEQDGFVVHRVERSYGKFQRTLQVPYETAPEQIDAEFKDGVLTIRLPKPPQEQRKVQAHKIPIKQHKGREADNSQRIPDQGAARSALTRARASEASCGPPHPAPSPPARPT